MNRLHAWLRWIAFPVAGAVAMAVLLPCLALMRYTTAHDWYAAAKLTVTEAMLGVGFADDSATEYRTPEGETIQILRGGLATYWEPLRARERIVYTTVEHAFLGVGAGAACGVFFVLLLGGANAWQRTRTGWPAGTAMRPPTEYPEAWNRPGFMEHPPRHDGGGARTGLLVVSPTQNGGKVEVYGPVEFCGPLTGGRLVRDGGKWVDEAGRPVIHANVPSPETTPALPAAAEPGTSAQSDSGGAPPPNKATRTAPRKEQTAVGDRDGARKSGDAALAGPDRGGSRHWV